MQLNIFMNINNV